MEDSVGRWSHREFLTRRAWVDNQWNRPNRSDHYLMQIAAEVRRVLSKRPADIRNDDFRLQFKIGEQEQQEEITHENAAERAAKSKAAFAPLIRQAVVRYRDADGS